MSILLIGDSHLRHCHNVAEKADPKANFGYDNIKVTWYFENDQVKHIEKYYRDQITRSDTPDAVFVLCGGYDLVLTNNSVEMVNKLKALVNYLNGLTVKHIIVCSILDRRGPTQQEEDASNRAIRNANKQLAKAFKNMNKIIFINIRPPGKLKDLIDDDKFHLKPECYSHVYKRLLSTLEERIIPQVPNAALKELKTLKSCRSDTNDVEINKYKKEPGIDKRMAEFKEILIQDYKRICLNEDDLTKKFNKIQTQLETVSKEKTDVIEVYKKLFGVDLSKEKLSN